VSESRQWLSYITPNFHNKANNRQPSKSLSSATFVSESSCNRQHLFNLQKYGITILQDTLSPSQVQDWNLKTQETFDNPKNIVWNRGRAHCNISKRSEHYQNMVHVGHKKEKSSAQSLSLQEIVQLYFEQHSIPNYRITQVQFLNAIPNKSKNQIWHRDNTFPGLTAIIALKDVTANGPTELLPKSHHSSNDQHPYTLWVELHNAWKERKQQQQQQTRQQIEKDQLPLSTEIPSCQPLLGCIHAGDAILYDARILHRGRGYTSSALHMKKMKNNSSVEDDNDRPVLVLRWDAVDTPPPGGGIILTTANGYLGSMLYSAFYTFGNIMSLFSS